MAALRTWCDETDASEDIGVGLGVEPEDLDRFLEKDLAYVEMGFTSSH